MKNTITLLLFAFFCSTYSAYAQPGTACNAGFNVTIAGLTAQFNPLFVLDTTQERHTWTFGDASAVSNSFAPAHTYTGPGVYIVKHKVSRVATNVPGVICDDSVLSTIAISSLPATCNIHANFNFIRDTVQTNKVYFTNTSVSITPNTIVKWSFGDGTYSTEFNPTHIYTASGLYNVCLKVQRDSLCFDDTCRFVQVQVPTTSPCTLVVNFSTSPDSANPVKIYFNNLSTPLSVTDSIRWTFGDGGSSSDVNPSHTYNEGGTYNVCLRIKKYNSASGAAPCIREYCRQVIVPTVCNLVPYFVYYRDTISGGNSYTFSNASTPLNNIDSSFWDFGDGSPVVINPANPVRHTYAVAGNYVVCLRVKKIMFNSAAVLCERQFCLTIFVTAPPPPCNLSVNFASRNDSANHRKIFFTNLTTPINTTSRVQWYFGDGSSSTGWNADHIYTHGGTYTVCLKVIRDSFCIRDTCKVIVVNDSIPPVQQCNYQVNFMRQFDSVNLQKVFFTNTTIVPVSASIAKWTFGDGAVAYGWNADHIYTAPGRYYVCLTVSVGNNCIKSKCDTITVGVTTFSCDSSRVRFEYRRDNYMPNKLFFFAISNTAIYQEQWSFSRVPSTSPVVQINQFNPVYVFGDTGLYRVCLRAMLSNGCVREYCDYIRIYSNAISTACYLQAFPNPAHNYVTVNAHLPQPELITASIYNLQNILVSQTTQQGFTGNNALILNIASLPTGFYTIRVVYGDRVCYSRFQKI